VGLRYGERAALDRVDLRVAPGERLVVVGETGSGKTTLGKVLTGLYRPDTGRVLVGGVPLASLPPDVLRATAVLIPQEVLLVRGTVADNLAMVPVDLGPDPRARIVAAADSLELAGWLRALPDGLDTEVGDHGSLVSAGERQLLALVRAALVDPLVLVLDEATAAVDPVTAARVEEALARASRDRVVVVIAHRPDTVDRAERRVELVSGRVRG
jgi:ABC-type multidrug transport system fused ATPase/permease subunit